MSARAGLFLTGCSIAVGLAPQPVKYTRFKDSTGNFLACKFSERKASDYLRIPSAQSLEECRSECSATFGCTGLEYQEDAGVCHLWLHGACDGREDHPSLSQCTSAATYLKCVAGVCPEPIVLDRGAGRQLESCSEGGVCPQGEGKGDMTRRSRKLVGSEGEGECEDFPSCSDDQTACGMCPGSCPMEGCGKQAGKFCCMTPNTDPNPKAAKFLPPTCRNEKCDLGEVSYTCDISGELICWVPGAEEEGSCETGPLQADMFCPHEYHSKAFSALGLPVGVCADQWLRYVQKKRLAGEACGYCPTNGDKCKLFDVCEEFESKPGCKEYEFKDGEKVCKVYGTLEKYLTCTDTEAQGGGKGSIPICQW